MKLHFAETKQNSRAFCGWGYFTLLFTDLRDRKAMHLPESHFRMKAKNAINTSSAAKRMLTDQEPRRYGMEAGVSTYMTMWCTRKIS